MLKQFPKNVLAGIDGLTNEVFMACWDFVKDNFYAMACDFWETGILVYKIKDVVIKLVPKSPIKLHAKDWRALTMLITVYKILAKLLSNRLKSTLLDIISSQQTRFIQGRNILEKVSIAKLVQDWLRQTGLEALFLQLDFQKAFDIISRIYHGEP